MPGFGLSASVLKTLLNSAKTLYHPLLIFHVCSCDVHPEAHQREMQALR